jgi:hypothetical protein
MKLERGRCGWKEGGVENFSDVVMGQPFRPAREILRLRDMIQI